MKQTTAEILIENCTELDGVDVVTVDFAPDSDGAYDVTILAVKNDEFAVRERNRVDEYFESYGGLGRIVDSFSAIVERIYEEYEKNPNLDEVEAEVIATDESLLGEVESQTPKSVEDLF